MLDLSVSSGLKIELFSSLWLASSKFITLNFCYVFCTKWVYWLGKSLLLLEMVCVVVLLFNTVRLLVFGIRFRERLSYLGIIPLISVEKLVLLGMHDELLSELWRYNRGLNTLLKLEFKELVTSSLYSMLNSFEFRIGLACVFDKVHSIGFIFCWLFGFYEIFNYLVESTFGNFNCAPRTLIIGLGLVISSFSLRAMTLEVFLFR